MSAFKKIVNNGRIVKIRILLQQIHNSSLFGQFRINQLTGVNAIIYYLKQLFGKVIVPSKQNNHYTQLFICFLAFTQIFATLLATLRIQKVGRRSVLVNGQMQIIIILTSIFLIDKCLKGHISQFHENYVIIVLIFVHIIIHNRSLGAMCIVYCADILNDLSWMVVAIKICSFFVALSSEYMIQYLGISNMFLIFAFLSLIVPIFVRKWVIQTKDLTKQQIYSKFENQIHLQMQIKKHE